MSAENGVEDLVTTTIATTTKMIEKNLQDALQILKPDKTGADSAVQPGNASIEKLFVQVSALTKFSSVTEYQRCLSYRDPFDCRESRRSYSRAYAPFLP